MGKTNPVILTVEKSNIYAGIAYGICESPAVSGVGTVQAFEVSRRRNSDNGFPKSATQTPLDVACSYKYLNIQNGYLLECAVCTTVSQ